LPIAKRSVVTVIKISYGQVVVGLEATKYICTKTEHILYVSYHTPYQDTIFMAVGLVLRHYRIFFTDCAKLRIEVPSDGKTSRIDSMKIGQLVIKLN
jgi:hypothetical protein